MKTLQTLKDQWIQEIEAVLDLSFLEHLRVRIFGKNGELTQHMKVLGSLDPIERKERGAALNLLRDELTQALGKKHHAMKVQALSQRLSLEKVDVSLPARPEFKGYLHPLSQVIFETTSIFSSMGFSIAEGNHIEEEYYNFDALNIPPEHPARQDHDTFYMPAGEKGQRRVLRTHTSPVQIRTMLKGEPPFHIICPGRVFRSDYDQTHTPTFHQVEGLVVAEGIHMGHLKHCLLEFLQGIFDMPDLPLRFRPSYFPFTEPSAEVDLPWSRQEGKILSQGGGDWLEILGCGMVRPQVLKNCHIDPERFQGFAFGMGIERIAMLKYGIPDLRSFYETDIRWLRRYGFSLAEGLMTPGGCS